MDLLHREGDIHGLIALYEEKIDLLCHMTGVDR